MKPLPDNILRRMEKSERAKMGKAGKTAQECQGAIEAKSERDIQNQIANWLRLKGIWFSRSRMDKRTTNQQGTPDFMFVWREGVEFFPGTPSSLIHVSRPTAIEVKYGSGKLSPEQELTRLQMTQNGWSYHVVRSLKEVVEIVRL